MVTSRNNENEIDENHIECGFRSNKGGKDA